MAGSTVLPIEVTQAAAAQGLGELRQIHRAGRRAQALLLAGLVAALLGLLTLIMRVGPDAPGMPYFDAAALAALALFAWLLLRSPVLSRKAREFRLYLYEHGFVQVSHRGAQGYRWDSVRVLYQALVKIRSNHVAVGTERTFSFVFGDGRRLKLTHNTFDMITLGPIIQQELARVQVPKARAHLAAGHSIVFGELTVSPAAIVTAKGPLPWAQVGKVDIVDGYLRVVAMDKRLAFARVPLAGVPNLETFRILAGELIAAGKLDFH